MQPARMQLARMQPARMQPARMQPARMRPARRQPAKPPVTGWRQAGGRLEAGWRHAGGRLEAGWRQAGGRLEASLKDLQLFGQPCRLEASLGFTDFWPTVQPGSCRAAWLEVEGPTTVFSACEEQWFFVFYRKAHI